jgi:hypothetical protein
MAMTTNDAAARQRREIEALLPWHAAGVLSDADTRRVEAALTGDSELARQYALVREELGETIHLNETLGAPSIRAMERLMAAIEADTVAARQHRRSFDVGSWIAGHLAQLSPRTLAWSAIVAALAIVLQAGLLTGLVVADRGMQVVLEKPKEPKAPGAFVLVGFKADANVADITRFLQSHKATMIEGPDSNAEFRVRVGDTKLPRDDLARIAKGMREDSGIVRFAAPTE